MLLQQTAYGHDSSSDRLETSLRFAAAKRSCSRMRTATRKVNRLFPSSRLPLPYGLLKVCPSLARDRHSALSSGLLLNTRSCPLHRAWLRSKLRWCPYGILDAAIPASSTFLIDEDFRRGRWHGACEEESYRDDGEKADPEFAWFLRRRRIPARLFRDSRG
jgi:hypothetical protein